MSRRVVKTGFPVSPMTGGFPSPIVARIPVTTGLEYAMEFQPRNIGIPTIPLPTRSSLGQMIEKYRTQRTLYLSRYRLGLQSLIGYPAARGHTVLNTAPKTNTKPQTTGRATIYPGTMGAPSRFTKALPAPIAPFNPPIYGES